jgi:hypothetical protein
MNFLLKGIRIYVVKKNRKLVARGVGINGGRAISFLSFFYNRLYNNKL